MASPASPPNAPASLRPLVVYDGSCAFCSAQAARLARLAGDRLELRPLQEEGLLARLGLSEPEALREMKLIDRGRVYGGAAAVVRALELARPALAPLLRLYRLPLVRPIADRLYRWVASNRYRLVGRRVGYCQEGCALSGRASGAGGGATSESARGD